MKFEGTFTVKAPPEKVFSFLMGPNAMAKCLPDVQSMEAQAPDKFRAKVKTGVGFIKGTFDFQFVYSEQKAPSHAKLTGHGTGSGSAVDMESIMDLSGTADGGTEMKWVADARISGLIAGVGSRLIDSAAKKIITQLFDSVRAELEK